MNAKTVSLIALLAVVLSVPLAADPPPPQQPDPISLEKASPSVTVFGNWPSDIYGEAGGPIGMGWDVGGPGPVMHIPFFAYGLQPPDEVDAHSLGHNYVDAQQIVYFSADRRSRGRWNTQYRHQANRNQAAGDRFVTNGWTNISPRQSYNTNTSATLVMWLPGQGPNLLSANQTRYNEIPSIPPMMVNPTGDPNAIDDMDALELHPIDVSGDRKHDFPLFFSLASGSPSLPVTWSPADILVSFPAIAGFTQWAPAASMGLAPFDDIDALVVFSPQPGPRAIPGVDWALFSLKPGNSLGADPASVYVTCFQGISKLFLKAETLGLRPMSMVIAAARDNVDGLDVEGRIEGNELPQIFDEIEEPPTPVPTPIYPPRVNPNGTPVNVHGIVTLIGAGYLYIEQADRTSGIRVEPISPVPWYVSPGDDLQVVGILGTSDGERIITPTVPVSEISSGNPLPDPFDIRSRDVGGDALDPMNPGVSGGRGAFNVGLRIQLQGMVTGIDPAGAWIYIWDGANRINAPLNDGSGNYGVRIAGGGGGGALWTDWLSVDGVVSTDSTAVPGRVIPEILPISVTHVTTFDTIRSSAGDALNAGWNLIALPAAPADKGDGVPMNNEPWDPWMILSPSQDPADLDSRLYRWESCSQSLMCFDMWNPTPFGALLMSDGYWLQLDTAWPVKYSAKTSTLDQWVSVCRPGWVLMGHPSGNGVPWADCHVHNGGEIKTLYDASGYGAGWLDSVGYWWDNSTQSLLDIGLPDDFPTTTDLKPWHGYWFHWNHGAKAVLIRG